MKDTELKRASTAHFFSPGLTLIWNCHDKSAHVIKNHIESDKQLFKTTLMI